MTTYENVAVKDLTPHPDNARKGNISIIKESIEANGFYGAVIAQRSTKRILVGNHRVEAAKELGLAEVPVLWVDCDDQQAKRIMLADNRSSDVATYDDRRLLETIESLPALTGTGYDADDLNDLLAIIQEEPTYSITTGNTSEYETPMPESKYGGPATRNTEPSYDERLEGYKVKGIRSIILDYEIDSFQEIVDMATRSREKHGVETNADLFVAFLRNDEA